jgi:hypothetical protein
MGNYFDKKTQDAIVEFNDEEDMESKHRIYDERIRYSLEKLVENIIMVYRFSQGDQNSYEALKNDCVSFLYERLPNFDPDRGSKAFSYYNVVAKNHLLAQQTKYSNKLKKEVTYVDRTNSQEKISAINLEQETIPSYEEEIIESEDFFIVLSEIKNWRGRYKKDKERLVLDGIVYLMENSENLDIINKKSVYLYLREITGLNTKQVVSQLQKFRRSYKFFKRRNNR